MSTHIPIDPMTCIGSAVSEPYWRGLSEGRLTLPVCDMCGTTFFFPRRWCPHCWSADISWITAAGHGTIYSTCQVNVPFDGRSSDEIPYAVALIDLAEGVRIPGRLHPSNMNARIGQPVTIDFGANPTRTLPVWVTHTDEALDQDRSDP